MQQRIVTKLIQVIISTLAVAAALVVAIFVLKRSSFGWFADSRSVDANGMNVQVQKEEVLQIRTEPTGPDISADDIQSVTKMISLGDAVKLSPGASGSFSFYVTKENGEAVSFRYRVKPANDSSCTLEPFPQGFYKSTTDEEQTEALKYLASHVLLFTSCEQGVYSGWICPDDFVSKSAGDALQPVTVYWVWVENYDLLFAENSSLMDADTRARIVNYYKPEKMNHVTKDGVQTKEAYNQADTLIGVTIKYVCFELEVTKG